jgi:GNAT superfamily N-acetyltransferase
VKFSLTRTATPSHVRPGELEVTITYLEMREPPRHQPLPQPSGDLAPDDLALVRADPPTVSFYRYLYNTVGEPWLWHERRRLGDTELAASVTDPRVEVHVLYVCGTPAGYVEIDRRETQATDLAYFGLIPDFIGMKLGPWLLDRGIRMAWKGGARKLMVNTCTFDHPKALPLYQSIGFIPARHVTRVVRDPRADGVLPRGAAPHVPMVR